MTLKPDWPEDNDPLAAFDVPVTGGMVPNAKLRPTALVDPVSGAVVDPRRAAPRTNVDAVIQNGQSVSDTFDCSAGLPCAIVFPAAFQGDRLAIQTSSDGGATFNPLFDENGVEKAIVAGVSRRVILNPGEFLSVTHMRLQSRTGTNPQTQSAQRTLRVVLAQ